MSLLIIIVLGLFIGSFLNVCIYRIPKDQSIIFPPSHCTNCNIGIKPYDLIPVISYIILRGKCRNCGEKISYKYPLIELLTALLFVSSYSKFNLSMDFIKAIVLLCVLIIVTFIDFEYSIIPAKLMIFGAVSGVVLNIVIYGFNSSLLTFLYGLLLGGGLILIIVLLTGGMGGGDIQLMAVIGLFLGFELTILTLLLSFIIGAAAGILLILLKKKKRKDYIPFGPWISMAAIITVFYGNAIINWYFSLF